MWEGGGGRILLSALGCGSLFPFDRPRRASPERLTLERRLNMGRGARPWKIWEDMLWAEGTRCVGLWGGRQPNGRLMIKHRAKEREGSWVLEDPVGQGRTLCFVLGVTKSLGTSNQSSVIW